MVHSQGQALQSALSAILQLTGRQRQEARGLEDATSRAA